jgi:hypothetical protein
MKYVDKWTGIIRFLDLRKEIKNLINSMEDNCCSGDVIIKYFNNLGITGVGETLKEMVKENILGTDNHDYFWIPNI